MQDPLLSPQYTPGRVESAAEFIPPYMIFFFCPSMNERVGGPK